MRRLFGRLIGSSRQRSGHIAQGHGRPSTLSLNHHSVVCICGVDMGRVIRVEIPPWLSEGDFRRILERMFAVLGGAVDIDDLRRELGVRPDELVEELEVYDVEELERREKERLIP